MSLDTKVVPLNQHLEDKEIQEILKSGTDLRQYSKQIEKDLKDVENQSIEEYIKESQNIASLHNQIGDCDNILERMETMLTNFQVFIIFNIRRTYVSLRFNYNLFFYTGCSE